MIPFTVTSSDDVTVKGIGKSVSVSLAVTFPLPAVAAAVLVPWHCRLSDCDHSRAGAIIVAGNGPCRRSKIADQGMRWL